MINGYAEVPARIATVKHEFSLEFHLVQRAGEWLAYDVIVDGVSLINSYRVQFARFLRSQSYQALLERMREKVDVPLQARAVP